MSFVLGIDPENMTLVLQANSAFVAGITNEDGPWGVGDQIELRFDKGGPWPATIATNTASWQVSVAAVQALIALGAKAVGLWYIAPDATAVRWARGAIEVKL